MAGQCFCILDLSRHRRTVELVDSPGIGMLLASNRNRLTTRLDLLGHEEGFGREWGKSDFAKAVDDFGAAWNARVKTLYASKSRGGDRMPQKCVRDRPWVIERGRGAQRDRVPTAIGKRSPELGETGKLAVRKGGKESGSRTPTWSNRP